MESFILSLNIIFAFILVVVILLQKSEGGALGLGVSQDSFISSRSAGNFLTKVTAIIATLFIVTSILLTIIGKKEIPNTNDVMKVIKFIKNDFKKNFKTQKYPKVLYGGSVNKNNIKLLSSIREIDGFLIGGASQSAKKFIDIIKNYYK